MRYTDFQTGQDDEGRRVDKVIRRIAPFLSLSEVYKALRKGDIRVNQKKIKPGYKIQNGDIIQKAECLNARPPKDTGGDTSLTNQKKDLTKHQLANKELPPVVFENEHLIIFNKPSGLQVHGENSLNSLFLLWYSSRFEQTSLSFVPGPLHRIDKFTSGLVVFSLSARGARWFSSGIKNHTVKKKYLGIVCNELSAPVRWEDFLCANPTAKNGFYTVSVLKNPSKNTQKAVTIAKPLSYAEYEGSKITLCEFEIETGRKHQIRAQSSFHGFPLFGDTAYGSKPAAARPSGSFFLHAASLSFPKNDLGIPETIACESNELNDFWRDKALFLGEFS